MYLKSLTLKGFKSFAQSTTFDFEPGVTAVVGPNGSGKSNVVDALSWVMGEQGAKSLRGGKMEDVIFAGTSSRGPLGRAEVKLTIDNSDGALPIEYSEVTISRTLFRNGASEYAINGEACRLLDVQELLSDSGLGNQMHVIVGQGQLDTVLRATAEDRRAFIEEAAGILKHRKRKERTLRKLDAMETNLTRLSDLAGEIRRQLRPLGRQAEVAKKAQYVAARVRDAKARILADDVFNLRAELEVLNRDESERHAEKVVLTEQQEQKLLRIKKLESEQLSDSLDEARRTSLDLERVQGKLRGLYDQVQQRLMFLATQTRAEEHPNMLSEQTLVEAQQESSRLEAELPEFERAWQEAVAKTAKIQQELDAVDQEIATQSALVASRDLELSKLRGKVDSAKQRLISVEQETERRANATAQAQARLTEAEHQFVDYEKQNKFVDRPDPALEQTYLDAGLRVSEIGKKVDEARNLLHQAERERAGLEAKLAALTGTLKAASGSEKLAEATLGSLAEHVRVNSGFETAVEAALGSLSNAFLVQTSDQAQEIIELAKTENLGRVSVVVAEVISSDSGEDSEEQIKKLAVDGNFTLVNEVIDAPAGVRDLMARSVIVDDVGHARSTIQKLTKALKSTAFTVVTMTGEVLSNSLWEGGSGEAPSKIELLAERDITEQNLAELNLLIEERNESLDKLKNVDSEAKAAAAEAFNVLRGADAEHAKVQREHNRLKAHFEAAQADLKRLIDAAGQLTDHKQQAVNAVAEAERILAEVSSKPKPFFDPGARDEAFTELEDLRSVELEAHIEFETRRERVRAQNEQRDSIARQLEARQKAAEVAARKEVLRQRQVAEAERIAATLPTVLDACDRSLAEARIVQQQAESERSKYSQELVLLRSEESEIRARLAKLTEATHSLELKAYERKLSLTNLTNRASEELGLVEDVLLADYGPDVPIVVEQETKAGADTDGSDAQTVATVETKPYDRAEQEKLLASAQRDLQELGRINPLALEEFDALEKRHAFLSEQLQDLHNTKKDLLSIIAEIDNRMEGIFEAAFNDTKAAFEQVFPILFPGGSGDIFLTDPENMLTTGIEVSVRPAGKKIERLSLLSGGERSLAAVAWLIAIFRARPSPFYIMDEVEAALDDANLGRLLQVFEKLRETSQLIVITHQKRTMEIADALYGVSMRGDGISVVVGQRVGSED